MPVDDACCPACGAVVGDAGTSFPLQCWKCGLQFGIQASNKPVLRPKLLEPRFQTWMTLGIAASPTVLYWLVGKFWWGLAAYFPWISSLSVFAVIGLSLYGFACLLYVLGKLANAEKDFRWILGGILFVLTVYIDAVLFLGAIAHIR